MHSTSGSEINFRTAICVLIKHWTKKMLTSFSWIYSLVVNSIVCSEFNDRSSWNPSPGQQKMHCRVLYCPSLDLYTLKKVCDNISSESQVFLDLLMDYQDLIFFMIWNSMMQWQLCFYKAAICNIIRDRLHIFRVSTIWEYLFFLRKSVFLPLGFKKAEGVL